MTRCKYCHTVHELDAKGRCPSCADAGAIPSAPSPWRLPRNPSAGPMPSRPAASAAH